MKSEKISELTTNRLSVYLRCLNELATSGVKTTSSEDLARRFQLNSAQIRKDLAYFGEFGVRGVGYYVETLRENLVSILGLNKLHRICIIGSGRLGAALADYYEYSQSNFEVAALFDSDPKKIGTRIGRIVVHDIVEFAKITALEEIDVAVIAIPASQAQNVLELIVGVGIKAVMNFAPIPLKAAADVRIRSVDLTISLESLSYFLAQNGSESAKILKAEKKKKPVKEKGF